MQRLRDKGKDLRSSFMSHFLACDDKSCTRLNDLLDRIFFEGKARHVSYEYRDTRKSFSLFLSVKTISKLNLEHSDKAKKS